MKGQILRSRWMLVLLVVTTAMVACKKEKGTAVLKEADKNSYVPRLNTKYTYSIINDDVNVGTATKWIDGGKDSAGIQVYNLHTNVSVAGSDMAMDNGMYVANGKTYASFNMPDAWYLLVEELRKIPNVQVVEARAIGFPGYIIVENAIKENSKLTWQVPAKTGQYLKYIQKQSGNNVEIEVLQEIVQNEGTATAVETITVPGGTFVCSKFLYTTAQKQQTNVDGKPMMNATGTETITLWMAHGIGVVKQEIKTIFNGNTTNATIVLNNIKS